MNAIEAYVLEEERTTHQVCDDLRDPAQDSDGEAQQQFAVNDEQRRHHDQQYHELFWPPGNDTSYLKPIVFGDGMDYAECHLYYRTHEAQAKGGVLTRRQQGRMMAGNARPSVQSEHRLRWFSSAGKSSDTTGLRPIIRRRNNHQSSPKKRQEPCSPRSSRRSGLLRRCSFTVAHPADRLGDSSGHGENTTRDSLFPRSQSVRDVGHRKSSSPRVTFQRHVEVHTIDAVRDIPYEVRRALWMSRSEMLQSIQKAASRAWEEQRAKQSADFARLFPMEEDDEEERSDDEEIGDENDVFKEEEMKDEEEFMSGLVWQPKRSRKARG